MAEKNDIPKTTKLPPLEGVPDKEPLRDLVDLPPLRLDAPVTHARVRLKLDTKGKATVEHLHFIERFADTRTRIAGDWFFDIHGAMGRVAAFSMVDPFESRGKGRPEMDDHSYGRATTATVNLDIPLVQPGLLDELRVRVVRLKAPFADIPAVTSALDKGGDIAQAKPSVGSAFDLAPLELFADIDVARSLQPPRPPKKPKPPGNAKPPKRPKRPAAKA